MRDKKIYLIFKNFLIFLIPTEAHEELKHQS